MKKIVTLVLIFTLFFSAALYAQQNVGIGTTTPDPTAKLDVTSTNQGLLIPRMSTATRNSISSPAPSLLIYNTTTDCLEMYSASGAWVSIGCGCQLPGAFSLSATSGLSQSSFTGNWASSAGATGYFLDVSTVSSFATFVTGYNNLSVGNVTTFAINSGLACGTTYFYRLRANNTCGTSANSGTITVTTSICGSAGCGAQSWAGTNANTGTEVNGGITQTAGQKYCYMDLPANCTTYGGLYQWASAMEGSYSNTVLNPPTINCNPCSTSSTPVGVQGVCVSGFHIPSDLEMSQYEYCIESTIAPVGPTTLSTFQTSTGAYRGSTTAGQDPAYKMKVTSSNTPSWDGNNNSGFTALPSGFYTTAFANLGSFAYFWTATESTATVSYYRDIKTGMAGSFRNTIAKTDAFAIRCLKN